MSTVHRCHLQDGAWRRVYGSHIATTTVQAISHWSARSIFHDITGQLGTEIVFSCAGTVDGTDATSPPPPRRATYHGRGDQNCGRSDMDARGACGKRADATGIAATPALFAQF